MDYYNNFYSSIKHRKFNTWCKYTERLDTYGCGCEHNCKYCYSKGLLNFRKLWDKPKPANIDLIYKKIKTIPSNTIVKLGGMTDCFQDIELEKRVTYKTIKMLNNKKIHYLIVTKSKNVINQEYINIYDKKLAHFQISVTSTSNDISIKYENASTPNERINSIEKLNDLGFDTSIRLSPFIEGFIDYSILNNIKCNKILIEFLKVNHFVKSNFNIDYSNYTLKYGGYNHLELNKKIEMIKNITGFQQLSIGEYVKDHHEYFKNNINYNKNDCCNLDLHLMNIKQKTIF